MKRKLYIILALGILLLVGYVIYHLSPKTCHYPTGEILSISKNSSFFKEYPKYTTTYYKNGNIFSKGKRMFARDIENWEYYYENGQLSIVRNYRENEVEGLESSSLLKRNKNKELHNYNHIWFETKAADELIIRSILKKKGGEHSLPMEASRDQSDHTHRSQLPRHPQHTIPQSHKRSRLQMKRKNLVLLPIN